MTVASSINRVEYTGNGSTTVFSFSFRIFAATDLVVTTADEDGIETVLELNTDYTVTGVGSYSGGSITLGSALASGQVMIIQRVLPLTQNTDLRNQGQFFAETHEDVFDRMAMINQQLQEQIDRSAKLPVTRQEDADALVADIVLLADNINDLNTIADSITDVQTVADDIADVNTVAGIAANVTTVAGVAANVTTVAGIDSEVTTVSGIAADVTSVAAIDSDVETVADNISAVQTVANDLNEPTSEIDVVAGSIANVNAVGNNISNVNTVAGVSSNVTTVAGIAANVSTVAGISGDVSTVAGISADVQAVENIAANVTTVAGIQANVTTVAGISGDVSTVAGIASDVAAVENIAANVTTVAGISSAVSTVATNNANVSTVATNISAVNTVAGDIAAIITAANDLNEAVSEIEVVANNITSVDTVGDNIADVSAVAAIAVDVGIAADNVADITNFADVYQGASSTAPTTRNDTSALQVGDLYFNTTDDQMKVYGGSGWQSVGSTVNGTSQRYRYIATAAQTTFTGSDSNTNTLAYDVGFIDVYLNGVRLDQTDYTATSGDSVVLASGAAADDEVNIVAYGNFELADHYNKTDADSRFVNVAGDTMTGTLNLDGTGQLRGYSDAADSLTLVGGEADTNNRIQIHGTGHPSTPNVMTVDLNGGEFMRANAGGSLELQYGQLKFPATQNPSANANTLDDYEEGTWSPTLSDGTTTISLGVGSYTKIGRVCTVIIQGYNLSAFSTLNANATLTMGGFPFPGISGAVPFGTNNPNNINLLLNIDGTTSLLWNGNSAIDFNVSSKNTIGLGTGTASMRGQVTYTTTG